MSNMASNNNGYFWNNGTSADLNNKIMLTAIVALAIVIVIVIFLHMYARWSLTRQAEIHRQLGIATAPITMTEQPKTGLDPSIIASIPTFIFKHQSTGTENTTTECAVCLSMFSEGDVTRLLPNCKHSFHAECIDMWFGSHSTCPICRADAEPMVQPQPEGQGTSDGASQSSAKIGGSGSRLSSFRRMLSRDRSSSRSIQEDGIHDLV